MGDFLAELTCLIGLIAFSLYWGNMLYDILVSSRRSIENS